jgi:hypothetical protein
LRFENLQPFQGKAPELNYDHVTKGASMTNQDKTICPYCGTRMKKWRTPPSSTWTSEYQFVCFNDACPYFVQGWQWMMEQMQVKASYRHRYNPENGSSGPLPVWSYEALKNEIMD